MFNSQKYDIDARYCPELKCRWKTYSNYKLILWAWMLNEISVAVAVAEMSHSGYYIHLALHSFSVIFIGIPLVYSEMCLAQYTNCNVITMWNYFPAFRPVGYGSIFLAFLKYIYVMALASWYLQYTFYAALDPPPWFSCDDFNSSKCMVKRVNVSVFQHCLESQMLFDDDCGIKTASNCFFEELIGCNNTLISLNCVISWKSIVSSSSISCLLFILSLRKMKFIQTTVKLLAIYVSVVTLVLLSIALSTSGAWYTTKITIDWSRYNYHNCYKSITFGFLSVGTGTGIIGFLSKDIPFRSPATMTSISTSLLSVFVTGMYALIVFSGIKTMSYYHGEEENVIEMGISNFFLEFASISEILSYFDETPIWGFAWFSSIFLCMLLNLWILHIFLKTLISDCVSFGHRHANLMSVIITAVLSFLSWPLFCSDITGAIGNAIDIIQLASSFLFSISLYWLYGYKKHNVDIIFMIGIKASYFWKIAWIVNPILVVSMLYTKFKVLETQEFDETFFIEALGLNHDIVIVYVVVGIYGFIVVAGILIHVILTIRYDSFRSAFFPSEDWGPSDSILLKSRKMFVPEIMTREFLYRQVRIHGYSKKRKASTKGRSVQSDFSDLSNEPTEWSALTSN